MGQSERLRDSEVLQTSPSKFGFVGCLKTELLLIAYVSRIPLILVLIYCKKGLYAAMPTPLSIGKCSYFSMIKRNTYCNILMGLQISPGKG